MNKVKMHRITRTLPRPSPESQAMALPQPVRQACLDLVRSGKTIGEVRAITCLSLDQVIGVINVNTQTVQILREVSV